MMTEALYGSDLNISRKRKRKPRTVLSCNDCRRRKLKCDRELPCNRCINGGVAHSCVYGWNGSSLPLDASLNIPEEEAQPINSPHILYQAPVVEVCHQSTSRTTEEVVQPKTSTTTTENAKDNRVEQLEQRVASLEACLLSLTAPLPIPEGSLHLLKARRLKETNDESNYAPMGLFKGRNYRTFCYGPTSPMTLITHLPEIRPFMKEVYQNSTLDRLSDDIKALEDRARTNKVSSRVLSVPYLRDLLPDRITVDLLVRKYMETFETTYRILHIPTFWADYAIFWDSPSGSNTEMDAILLAILACVLCTSTHDNTRYDPNGSTFRSKGIIWIKACEAWLKRQSNKHRTLATLQVKSLRLLALMTTCLKTKEFYQEMQAHLAFMRSVGMHRDPSILGCRCSVFEGEIRRRLWATSIELELQTSIDKGTSSILTGLEYDCAPPLNINDSELQPDMQQLPRSHPSAEFTNTSFLHHSLQTTTLRVKLCALGNSLHCAPDFQEILQYERRIQDGLSQIPKWSDHNAFQAWTLLDLQLRQFLVILHTPRVLQTRFRLQPDYRYSILTCLESSSVLIDHHIELIDTGVFALCCIRSDYYRAALLISHIAYHAAASSDTLLLSVAKPLFADTMTKALRLQEERAMRPGRGSHKHWYLSAAYSLVSIQLDPHRVDICKREAVDRVARLLYKILSLQDSSDEYLANEVVLGEENSPASARINAGSIIGEASAMSSDGLPLRLDLDFNNTSEWMLDDFWHFNDFLAVPFNG